MNFLRAPAVSYSGGAKSVLGNHQSPRGVKLEVESNHANIQYPVPERISYGNHGSPATPTSPPSQDVFKNEPFVDFRKKRMCARCTPHSKKCVANLVASTT